MMYTNLVKLTILLGKYVYKEKRDGEWKKKKKHE